MDHTVSPTMEEAAGKAAAKLSSTKRKVTASQSQVLNGESIYTISSQPDSSRKETGENNDIFEDEAADSLDLSFSIDKDVSELANPVDYSSTASTPEKLDQVNESLNEVTKVIEVNEHEKPFINGSPGQNDKNDEDLNEIENALTKSGTKRPSMEAESSSGKKMRLNSRNEEMKTESNTESTTTADHSANMTDETSDLFGDSLQLPNTSGYFNELEKSVLEQVATIADKSKDNDVEMLTQGGLSMEHLLKSNNCPLCLKWFDKIVVHVKNCAAKKKVTTDKLFDAIKLQLKQHQEREAMGLPPLVQQPPPKKKNKKKAAVSIPEGYDSSLELAKALSASHSMESPGNLDAESSTETSSVDDNNSRKSAPIFGPASGTSKLKGGSSLLFNRSEEDRERIVTEKVAIVLLHSDEQDNLITETAPAIPSSSKMKENLNKGNLSVNGERIETITTEDCLQSTSLSATKLMNEIDKSPKASFKPENENVIGVNLENVEKPDRYNGPISVRKMNKNSRSLKNNMRKLFEDRVMCDLSVIVEDGYEIEVHKLILRVQCAAILDELVIRFVDDEPKRYIIWNTVPKDVAMAFFEYIYCEDLAKANNLAEEKLKIFMDLVERYDMTGLKFIMKDVQMNNEFDIEEQVRDIDEATTATNSSGDEHNVNVMNVAGNASETATPNKSTPTLDRSKVVKYPLKKRLRNSDPNVSQEVSRNSPASTSISTRRSVLTKSQLSNKKSSKVSLTIDSHSADSTDDIQIIGEEKKDTPNMKPDVITLSDDSDNANDSHDHYGVGNKFKNRIATPVATLVARKKTSGYGSKRIWESSDSESEGGLDVSVPRPSSLSKESSKPSRGSVNPFFHDYWCKETPSTSKAASQFEWEGYKTDYGTYREHNSNKTGSNTKLHKDRDLTNRLGGSNYDFRIGDVLESTSTQSTSTNNWYTQTISEKNSNIEPFGLWSNGLNVNSQEITTGNQRFQPGRESFLYKNKRKRRCSATITRSELDAMEDIAYSAAQEFSDSSRSPVKADTNVSLLNVDDDLFKNVETPDTSATNNAPEITAPAIPSSSKQMNGDDNQGEFTVYPYTQHTPAEKIPLAEVMFEKNENPVPYGSKSSIFHKAENLARPWWNPPQVHEDGGSQAADREVTLNNTLLLPNGNEAPNNKANINAAPMATPFFVPDKGVPLSKTALPLLHELVLKQDEDPEFLQINHQAPDDVLAEAPAGANQYEDLNLVKNGMPTSPTHLIADAPTTKDPTQPSRVTIQQMREAIGAIMKENNVAGAQVGEDPMKVEVDEVPLLNEAAPAPVNFLADAPIHFIADAPVDGNPMKVEVDEVPLVNEAAPAPVDLARIPVRDVRVDQARVNNDVIVEPAHSPRPCFTKMKKAELMQHLERYGVKTNMTCVRARKLLTHIYDFTHQEINVARGKKISAKKEYNRGDLQKMIDDLEGNNSPRKRLISDPEVNRMAGVTENRIPDVGPYPGTSRQEDEMQNQIELTVLEQAMLVGETLSDTYRELLELENKRVVINTEEFECPCCFDNIEPGGGIILKDCVHSICRTCLTGLVESSDEVAIKCPCCTSVIQEREIKEVVAPQIFEKYLSKSLAVTANSIENAFHCKTPDCRGWCIIDDIINQPVNVFNCPRCGIANCIQCQATHPSMNCLEYQNHLAIQAEKDPIAKKSLLYMEKLKKSKKALNCPKCQIVIVKTEGCDWIQCSMCKCEICWATMGPRWGPRGFGDTSGGCRCKLNMGAPCTPKCRNCH